MTKALQKRQKAGSLAKYNPKKDLEDAVDPTGELARDLASTTGDTKPAKAADAPGEDQQAYADAGSETPDAGDADAKEPAGDADSGSSEESSAKSGTGG